MKNRTLIITVCSVLLVIIAVFAAYILIRKDMPVFAYVDNGRLFKEASIILDANDKIAEARTREQEKLSSLENELGKVQALIEYSGANDNLQEHYGNLYRQYQTQMQQSQRLLEEAEEEHLTPAIKRINALIKEYAEEHGYDFILGATSAGNIVHAGKEYEITDEVIEYVNQK